MECPFAIWKPLAEDHSASGISLLQRNLIVLHVTLGPSAQSAINTFAASVRPDRTSCHFVIDRDGTIYQLVSITRTAWHASQVNSRSVGIEHAGRVDGTLPITPEQIQSSAKLVSWVAKQLDIPIDSDHVKSHNSASPRDKHVLCCEPTLSVEEIIRLANETGE